MRHTWHGLYPGKGNQSNIGQLGIFGLVGRGAVPAAYPSLRPLSSWIEDLIQRCAYLQRSPTVHFQSYF